MGKSRCDRRCRYSARVAGNRRVTNTAADGAGTTQGVANTSRANDTSKWLRAKASAQHSELLLAVLYVAAAYFSLCGCVGARVGRAIASVEGILECKRTFTWWWLTDRPQDYWYFQAEGNGRLRLTEIFGKEEWTRCSFVQCIIADDDNVNHIRRNELGIPKLEALMALTVHLHLRQEPQSSMT